MSKIIKKKVSWVASVASDVVAYKMYWSLAANGAPTYDSESVQVNSSKTQIIIPDDVPNFPIGIEDNYILGISAIDDVGNESDIAVTPSVPFDFDAPDAPSGISVANA